MSGRLFTTIAVSICLLLVAFAFWQRTLRTRQVRTFWGATEASLIQHAPIVHMQVPGEASPWKDISHAPGLVHLRATLVDDRYFVWSQQVDASAESPDIAAQTKLQFKRDDQQMIELAIDSSTGRVTNLRTQLSVPLIPASKKAIAAYLKEIQ